MQTFPLGHSSPIDSSGFSGLYKQIKNVDATFPSQQTVVYIGPPSKTVRPTFRSLPRNGKRQYLLTSQGLFGFPEFEPGGCTCIAVQNQKAVSAHFTSEQILPYGFAERCRCVMFALQAVYQVLCAQGISTVLFLQKSKVTPCQFKQIRLERHSTVGYSIFSHGL